MKMDISIVIILLLSFFSCDKENNDIDKSLLIGTWVNTINNIDTINIDNEKIHRIDTLYKVYNHIYTYTIDNDKIIIDYIGKDKILIEPKQINIEMNKDNTEITFSGINEYYPKYPGETFKKLQK